MAIVNSAAAGVMLSGGISVPNMADRDPRRAKITPADEEAARRLRKIWKTTKLTQDEIANQWAKLWGESITQGMVSQYMRARSPLNLKAVLTFATILECEARDIRSDLPRVVGTIPPATRIQKPAS